MYVHVFIDIYTTVCWCALTYTNITNYNVSNIIIIIML